MREVGRVLGLVAPPPVGTVAGWSAGDVEGVSRGPVVGDVAGFGCATTQATTDVQHSAAASRPVWRVMIDGRYRPTQRFRRAESPRRSFLRRLAWRSCSVRGG